MRHNTAVLVESKYKRIASIQDVSRCDLYQAIAYCNHLEVSPSNAFVVFPAINSETAPVQVIGRIDGFQISCESIYLLSINLSNPPKIAAEELGKIVLELLGE